METGYLNFHDAEHFSDFELPLDQHNLLDDSENSLMAIVNTDFDYIESMDISGGLWDAEQELNGDIAVLPNSGVSSVSPKFESIKEDFTKVLSDWQEHIGYMQASDLQEDIDLATINIQLEKLSAVLPDDIFQNDIIHSSPKSKTHKTFISPIKNVSSFSSLIDIKPILSNSSILPDEILQSISPVKNAISPIKIKIEPNDSQVTNTNIQVNERMDTDDCIDIETVPEYEPVLEAGDVKSLLEQFEASEVGMSKKIVNNETKPTIKKALKRINNKKRTDQEKQISSKKSECKKGSKLHKNIRDSLPKEVIDRIKASGVRRSKAISIIPAMPNPTKSNRIRENSKASTNSRNKVSKNATDKKIVNKIDGSVQLDHDYCSTKSSVTESNCDEKIIGRKKSTTKKHPKNSISKVNEEIRTTAVRKSNSTNCSIIRIDNNSKKDSGLESGDVSDASEEPTVSSSVSSNLPIPVKINQRVAQLNSKPVNFKPVNNLNNTINNNETNIKSPAHAMKVRAALATNILQLRDSASTKIKSIDNSGPHKSVPMISVLKKPPLRNAFLKTKCNESVAPVKNSSNDTVQNVIVQDLPVTTKIENEKKPPRRKLNLAEYRSRRDQGDNSRTCSPIQPMTLIYIHHASTTTEPIKDDPLNPIWSEREIVSMLKPKNEVENDSKTRVKPETREIATQTDSPIVNITEKVDVILPPPEIETKITTTSTTSTSLATTTTTTTTATSTSLETSTTTASTTTATKVIAPIINIDESENEDKKINRVYNRKQRSYRQQRHSTSSSSCSRSRSRSRSRLRGRSRSRSRSRSLSRSRSRSRSHTRSRRPSSSSRSRSLSRRRTRTRRRTSSSSSRSSSRSSTRSRSSSRRRNTRRRRVSRRRSSVSSSSSWLSRSRSRSTYRSRSRSTSSYSRSTSFRSRSSSSYSNYSRFSRRSNLERSERSRHQRRVERKYRTTYDRQSRGSSRSNYGYRYYRERRSSSYRRPHDVWCHQEKKRQIEERRVIYVGRLEETITKADLKRRFEAFGPVVDISLHFREHGDNYGFVTFTNKNDAYEAVEHGNDDPSLPRYVLCFGGRRAFCKVKYADLDGMASNSLGDARNLLKSDGDNTFDLLLKEAQAKLRNRKV